MNELKLEDASILILKPIIARPELAFIIATRAILGAKAVGSTLTLVGLATTMPAVCAVFGKCE